MIICVTGHRPDKLFGYDLSDQRYILLKERFKEILKENECTEAITGMAIGTDLLFAMAVLELKMEGYPILLHCAVPCLEQEKFWNKKDKERYHQIIKQADKITMVTNEKYTKNCMQKRNQFMVDLSDEVIAVWDGSNSGTKNCVDYAVYKKKEIIRIHPSYLESTVEKKAVFRLYITFSRMDGIEYGEEVEVLAKSENEALQIAKEHFANQSMLRISTVGRSIILVRKK